MCLLAYHISENILVYSFRWTLNKNGPLFAKKFHFMSSVRVLF